MKHTQNKQIQNRNVYITKKTATTTKTTREHIMRIIIIPFYIFKTQSKQSVLLYLFLTSVLFLFFFFPFLSLPDVQTAKPFHSSTLSKLLLHLPGANIRQRRRRRTEMRSSIEKNWRRRMSLSDSSAIIREIIYEKKCSEKMCILWRNVHVRLKLKNDDFGILWIVRLWIIF